LTITNIGSAGFRVGLGGLGWWVGSQVPVDTPIDGFELLQKYLVKRYPDLNFSLLDIEEAKKEMLTWETGPNECVGKSGFVSHTKHTVEATITDLLHS